MHTKETNPILHLSIAFIILLFISQISVATRLKYKDIVANNDTTELNESPDEILIADPKIVKEVIDSLDSVKSETVSSILGFKLISDLNENGFCIDEETTMQELCNMHDSYDLMINLIANDPKIIANLSSYFSKKHTSATSLSSSRRGLGIFSKILISTGLMVTQIPSLTAENMPTEPMMMMTQCSSYAYNATMMAKEAMVTMMPENSSAMPYINNMMWTASLMPKYIAECCKQWMPGSGYKVGPMYKITAEQIKMVSDKICTDMPKGNSTPLIAGVVAAAVVATVAVTATLYCRSKRKGCFSRN